MAKLELFYKSDCPWCHKVMGFMDAHHIELEMHDIYAEEDGDAERARLIEFGGKRQVPCLFIDGKALYESSDIIDYLGREFGITEDTAADTDVPSGTACSIAGGCSFK